MLGEIIQAGNAKNKGRSKNNRISEIICINPVSFKVLLEIAKFNKANTKNPVKPLYKKIRASRKDSVTKPYTATTNIKLQANAKTCKKSGNGVKFFPNLMSNFISPH